MAYLTRLGISHPIGWRPVIAGGFVLAFLGAYLLMREIPGCRWPAIVAATVSCMRPYAPYVLRNALERGFNEAYCMMLYPLALWGLAWVAKRPMPVRFFRATTIWAAWFASYVL